jgi:hypothetical protein
MRKPKVKILLHCPFKGKNTLKQCEYCIFYVEIVSIFSTGINQQYFRDYLIDEQDNKKERPLSECSTVITCQVRAKSLYDTVTVKKTSVLDSGTFSNPLRLSSPHKTDIVAINDNSRRAAIREDSEWICYRLSRYVIL